jgi:diadenosine tetraphosphatase ApaH/serine/threonine PP2A family protein phosphatase
LLYLADAESNFQHFDTEVCFIGHSHSPVIIERRPSGGLSTNKKGVDMGPGNRYIINVGSVGQPRDGDPRACYTLVDEERVEIVKVPYRVEITQRKMTRAGLPSFLVERLAVGM